MTTEVSTARSILRIGRLNVTYLLPRDHPAPARVRSKLDAVAGPMLAASSARLLGPLCDDRDSSVWFVRSLSVDVSINAAWEAERLGEAWAAQVTRSLGRRLAHGDDGADVLRFPNRAAWLAQFLGDLADGTAWSKWYYGEMDGLRPLACNAALREAICREPKVGESALLQLAADGHLDKVLRAMSESDCRVVSQIFCGNEPDEEAESFAPDHLRRAWQAWQRAPSLECSHRVALQLHLTLRHETAVRASPVLLKAISAFLALVRWMDSSQGDRLLRALRRGDSSGDFSFLGGESAESLATLLRCERKDVVEIAEDLRSRKSPLEAAAREEGESLFTSFGGIFHLLPHLAELDLEECAAALPEFEGDAPTALVRFLVLLKCLGGARAPHAFFDPVLRQVAGVSPDLDAESVRVWARSVAREQAEEFQKRWAACCRRRGVVGSRFYSVHSVRRGKMLLVKDCERGCWLRVERSIDSLIGALAGRPAEELPEALLCDPLLMKMLPARIAEIPVCAWSSPEVSEWAVKNSALATCLEHTRPPDDDLNYLSLTTLLRGARCLDLTLSLAAREVLRSFARRLPGFAWSSCEYLRTNFLDTNANIEAGSGGWVVRLTRPPLHVVLAMTGGAQDAYHLSWLGDQRIQLATGES